MHGLCGQDLGDGIWFSDSGTTALNVESHLISAIDFNALYAREPSLRRLRCSARVRSLRPSQTHVANAPSRVRLQRHSETHGRRATRYSNRASSSCRQRYAQRSWTPKCGGLCIRRTVPSGFTTHVNDAREQRKVEPSRLRSTTSHRAKAGHMGTLEQSAINELVANLSMETLCGRLTRMCWAIFQRKTKRFEAELREQACQDAISYELGKFRTMNCERSSPLLNSSCKRCECYKTFLIHCVSLKTSKILRQPVV